MTTRTANDLVSVANAAIQTLPAEEAVKLVGDPNVVFVDVREGEELKKTGTLRGAVHVPRGFLEFHADPSSPTHKPELSTGKKLVLYCGSGNLERHGSGKCRARSRRLWRLAKSRRPH